MLRDTAIKLGKISIFNHWLLALLMIAMLGFGLYLEEMPRSESKAELMDVHKSVGILVLMLGLWRISWRIAQGPLSRLSGIKTWEHHAAKAMHILLMVGIVVMPVSGWIMVETKGYNVSFFGLFNMPALAENPELHEFAETIHAVAAKILILAIVLHAAAAIKHHVINKNDTLKRMLGQSST